MTWQGDNRRKEERPNGGKDHDLLIRIDQNLSNFMIRFNDHVEDDQSNFETLYKRTGNLQKFMWLLLGALSILEVAIRFME